jgi:outer membrane lipoprotein SlyB
MRGGRRFAATATVALASAAWAQTEKPLDLRPPPPDAPSAGGSVCRLCGEIKSIREVHVGTPRPVQTAAQTESIGSPAGTDDWRVVGPVAYLPLGGGTKTDEGWRVGAAGTPEMQGQFGQSSYEISVQMDSGERRSIQRRDGTRFHVGQRVALRSGELEPMFP